MSKTIDIVLIDGPDIGVVLNAPQPVAATIDFKDNTYTTGEFNQVHIAYLDEASIDISAASIVAASGLTPSWDLK